MEKVLTENRWLIQHGHKDEATQVLAAIEGKEIHDPFVQAQQAEIQYSVDYEREHAIGWRAILLNKTNSRIDQDSASSASWRRYPVHTAIRGN